MASVGWIDFSPEHRNRIGSVLDLLKPEGVVDELGLGTIRDALANHLFPGISTIQTRAKYFFIIPYILYDYQGLKPTQRRVKTPSHFLEEKEYEIMWQLADDYNHKEGTGVIGITKYKPQKIARRPSAIYWNGLYTYNFIDTRGLATESFLKQAINPTLESLLANEQKGDDAIKDDKDAEHESMFRIRVTPNQKWAEGLKLDLNKEEAGFFADRIVSKAKNKLIAELMTYEKLWNIFSNSDSFMTFAKSAWHLPLSNGLKNELKFSHDFSELMYGVHLAYNSQLQRKTFNNNYYDVEWQHWVKNITSKMLDYANFNPDDLSTYAHTTRGTTAQFVKEWWHHTQHSFRDLKKRDKLIHQQEAIVKGSKARLQWNKTDDVKEEKWMGLKYFDYRFRQARIILNDIRTGLGK